MKRMRLIKKFVVGILLFAIVCSAEECDSVMTEVDTRDLFVAMYPYIPDANNDSFKAMTDRIKTEFETAHPEINLTVVVSDTYDTYDEKQHT